MFGKSIIQITEKLKKTVVCFDPQKPTYSSNFRSAYRWANHRSEKQQQLSSTAKGKGAEWWGVAGQGIKGIIHIIWDRPTNWDLMNKEVVNEKFDRKLIHKI